MRSSASTEPFRGLETIYVNESLIRADEKSRLGLFEDRSAVSAIDQTTELASGIWDARRNLNDIHTSRDRISALNGNVEGAYQEGMYGGAPSWAGRDFTAGSHAGHPLTTTNQRASDNLNYRAPRPFAETPGVLDGGKEGRLQHRAGS